jgi:hypothetical protein
VTENLNDAKNKQFQQRHSRESGNPERKTGFRVKPGMADPKVLRKWYPDTTCQLGSDAIASTILTLLKCQFMQLMGELGFFRILLVEPISENRQVGKFAYFLK